MTDRHKEEWELFKEDIFAALEKYENTFDKQDQSTRMDWNMEITAHRHANRLIQKIDDIVNSMHLMRDEIEELKGEKEKND